MTSHEVTSRQPGSTTSVIKNLFNSSIVFYLIIIYEHNNSSVNIVFEIYDMVMVRIDNCRIKR